jgi:hypothetical protein
MIKYKEFTILQWLAAVAALISVILGSVSIYDRFFTDELTIEQRLSPEMMDRLKSGEKIKIEKGITIEETE